MEDYISFLVGVLPGWGALGNEACEEALCCCRLFLLLANCDTKSIGTGNIIVEFFSAAIEFKVCKFVINKLVIVLYRLPI